MGWNISVTHEEIDGRVRLVVEAEPDVPDDVVSVVTRAYWFLEVTGIDEDWEEADLELGPMQG